MRLLLDESVPRRFQRSLPEHEIRTVVDMGWSGIKNGKLLALAANEFDPFLTVDTNLPFQQNLATLPVTVIVLDSLSNELSALLPLVPSLKRAGNTDAAHVRTCHTRGITLRSRGRRKSAPPFTLIVMPLSNIRGSLKK